jgi:hypothetical protein
MFLDGSQFLEAVATIIGEPPPNGERARNPDRARREQAERERHAADRGRRDLEQRHLDAVQRAKAAWLWSRRRPIVEGSPPSLYLRKRGYVGPIPATLGYLPAIGEHPAAMIAAFGFAPEIEPGIIAPSADVRAVHLTRLTPQGDKACSDPVKLTLGPSMGVPIVLAPMNDLLGLAITEGIEDALSVHAGTVLGSWAAGAAGRMPALVGAVPDWTDCVTIYAHADDTGQRHAIELADALTARGFEVFLEGLAP